MMGTSQSMGWTSMTNATTTTTTTTTTSRPASSSVHYPSVVLPISLLGTCLLSYLFSNDQWSRDVSTERNQKHLEKMRLCLYLNFTDWMFYLLCCSMFLHAWHCDLCVVIPIYSSFSYLSPTVNVSNKCRNRSPSSLILYSKVKKYGASFSLARPIYESFLHVCTVLCQRTIFIAVSGLCVKHALTVRGVYECFSRHMSLGSDPFVIEAPPLINRLNWAIGINEWK